MPTPGNSHRLRVTVFVAGKNAKVEENEREREKIRVQEKGGQGRVEGRGTSVK